MLVIPSELVESTLKGSAGYNQLYRITDVPVGGATSITVSSASSVGGYTETGIGATNATGAFLQLTGEAIGISSLTFDRNSGLGTVATTNRHGLSVDQKVTDLLEQLVQVLMFTTDPLLLLRLLELVELDSLLLNWSWIAPVLK